jgi:hypothetical protein
VVAVLADNLSIVRSGPGGLGTVRWAPLGLTGSRSSGSSPAVHRLASQPSRAVVRRRRLAAVGLLAVVVVGCWFGLQAALGRIGGGPLAITGAPGGLQPAASRVWIVRPGDTLWSIAEAVDPRHDVRPLVDRMAAETGTTVLYPGEAIAVPGG